MFQKQVAFLIVIRSYLSTVKAICLAVSMMILTPDVYAQEAAKDSLKIAYAQQDINDKTYSIPPDVLDEHWDALVIGFEYDSIIIKEKKSLEISWPGAAIDGRYVLVITPKQVYLRSSHDNPNPDYLYWLSPITKKQYDLIRRHLNAPGNRHFRDGSNEYSYRQSFYYATCKEEKYIDGDWTDRRYDNVAAILDWINKGLKAYDHEMAIPEKDFFNKIRPLRLVLSPTMLSEMREVVETK